MLGDGKCLNRIDNGVNFINKDIAQPTNDVNSVSECCSLCVKKRGCTIYSYVKEKRICRYRNSTSGRSEQGDVVSGYTVPLPVHVPVPNQRQLEFMDLEFTQVRNVIL